MKEKLLAILCSRRFYAAVLGAALVYINSVLKVLDDNQMAQVTAVISAWILGNSLTPAATPNQ
jgi:hypothetical protein